MQYPWETASHVACESVLLLKVKILLVTKQPKGALGFETSLAVLVPVNHPILAAASVHNSGVVTAAMSPLAPAHVLFDKDGYPYAPTVFFRQEPRPSLTKQMNPLSDVHSTSWQVQSALPAKEPSVCLHGTAATSRVLGAATSNSMKIHQTFKRDAWTMLLTFRNNVAQWEQTKSKKK